MWEYDSWLLGNAKHDTAKALKPVSEGFIRHCQEAVASYWMQLCRKVGHGGGEYEPPNELVIENNFFWF